MASEDSRGKDLRRLVAMLKVLVDGENLDAATASRRFAINPDPARRNLKILVEELPWIRRERRGGKDVFFFDPNALSSEQDQPDRSSLAEAIASSFGAAFSQVFSGTTYQVELDALRARVVERLATQRQRHFEHIGRKVVVLSGREEILRDRQPMLDDVIDAVLRQKCVKITFRKFSGEEEERVLKPYSLVVYDAHLYVVGLENERLRTYRFARLLSVDATGESFSYPEPNEYDPAVVFRDSIGIWMGEPDPCRIVVRLSSQWGVYARHHRWHQSQQVLQVQDDGAVDVELRCRPCPELEQWVLRFGEGAEVLEPRELRERIASRLAEASKRYARTQ